jgi:hypothetical protein
LLNDSPQQTNITELFGRLKDTIVTYVLRNGRLDTYTFRLPVITKVVNPQDGSVRTTTRYASGGAIVSKVEDGNRNLIQVRRSFGLADGSTVTRTEYPDKSWRQVRTIGQADGTILRESTSGFSSLGSGMTTSAPRPPILKHTKQNQESESTCMSVRVSKRQVHFLASGISHKPTVLPPSSFATGSGVKPPKFLPPPPRIYA